MLNTYKNQIKMQFNVALEPSEGFWPGHIFKEIDERDQTISPMWLKIK